MASKYENENDQDLTEDDDGIRPEDSASNISAPTSMTSSMARHYRNQRAAAALKLKMIEEEAALEEMERNIEMTTVIDERELRRRRREAKRQAEELEEEERLKQLEAEQRRKSLQAEKRKLEAQKALLEAEKIESMVSIKSMSRTSRRKSTIQAENGSVDFRRIGSGTNISIRRPSTSTPIVRLQPTSFLQGVTPLKGIFSDDNSSERKSHAASLPPSYTTHDPVEYGSVLTGKTLQHSFSFDYHEHPRDDKTLAGNETDPQQQSEGDLNGVAE